MPGDKTASGEPERQRINLLEPSDVKDWCSRLAVSVDDLKEAVEAVGNDASKVGEYLRRRKNLP